MHVSSIDIIRLRVSFFFSAWLLPIRGVAASLCSLGRYAALGVDACLPVIAEQRSCACIDACRDVRALVFHATLPDWPRLHRVPQGSEEKGPEKGWQPIFDARSLCGTCCGRPGHDQHGQCKQGSQLIASIIARQHPPCLLVFLRRS